jgi:hypothetical protein
MTQWQADMLVRGHTHLHRLVLSHDALVQMLGEVEQSLSVTGREL